MKGLRKEATITVDWDAVRDMFDFDDYADVVPINAANLCPSFHAVQEYVNQMGIDMNKDVSIQKSIPANSHACGLKTSISRRLTPAGQFLTPD